ncbi:molybdopterin-guanine dinucleotide biosynthesis protein A [Altererythrobacter atlanticus]|uniref:Molybdopterin-guanine dinucleotide biosynthesis protein MobA n=1 Tax=Croceibacterium atlanticum TaxID=1267766 RepID=A0A0F7KVR3_9SPHN|nr:molybdenum cofactor guanylyltransferase [Croceibacterium atlanticum]AKH43804.1 molybdopterin-guanine dinucleotide biosynthesis protein MobA [Croceibacterium atlanticum]MBB5733746.1 molybdopterin-guanine dinucleotide biosynthesis protein A [Croceibacterium atlanticum]
MILGVVLAGGLSTRFGSDKALAEYGGHTLLARAVDAMSGWCEYVVIAGRETGPAPCIPDWPRPGMGPLAGVAAGLRHALDEDYESVLTCGVDSPNLPENLLELLSPPSAYLETQPVIGHWKANAASIAEAILQSEGRHSMLAFAEAAKARAVKSAYKPANINRPSDLAAMEQRDGL